MHTGIALALCGTKLGYVKANAAGFTHTFIYIYIYIYLNINMYTKGDQQSLLNVTSIIIDWFAGRISNNHIK